jgi:hypothetical protein
MADRQLELGFATSTPAATSGLVLLSGPRAAMARLERDVLDRCPRSLEDLRAKPIPIRVVVPTRAFRLHVLGALARRGPLLGVTVDTIGSVARSIVGVSGDLAGDRALGIVVRRLAAEDPLLRALLGHLEDPFGSLVGVVGELLDAGLDRFSLAPAVESILQRTDAARTASVLALAAGVRVALEGEGFVRRSDLLTAAARRLRDSPAALPGGPVFVAGFTRANGAAAELLSALVESREATMYACTPPDSDLALRLAGRGRQRDEAVPPPVRVEVLEAEGRRSACRHVALAVRAALAEGFPPERIAIAVRDAQSWRSLVGEVFLDLGVPVALPPDAAGTDAVGRRLRAVLALLGGGGRATIAQWFAAYERPPWARSLALRTLGVRRLQDLLDLPAMVRATAVPWSEIVAERERVAEFLEAWAGAGTNWLDRATKALPLAEADRAVVDDVMALVAPLAALRPDRAEWVRAFQRAVAEVRGARSAEPGGVVLVDADQAVGMVFERLFLLGIAKDVLPAPIEDEPLLPDGARRALRAVLPDLELPGHQPESERFVFESLLAAAPVVTVGWEARGRDGRATAASPFVGRLLQGHGIATVQAREQLGPDDLAALSPPREHAILAGLFGFRENHAQLLAEVIAETAPNAGSALIEAKAQALAELDPDLRTRDGRARSRRLGPFFGFPGTRGESDRAAEPAVTTLESFARCGWRTFLTRELGVEPPVAWAQERILDPAMLGRIVHGTLERIAREGSWPSPADLERIVASTADEELARDGKSLGAGKALLAARALPFLEIARAIDWNDRVPDVEGVEVSFSARPGDGSRAVPFRADRVDRRGAHARALTDYKTAGPLSWRASEHGRKDDLVAATARAEHLQAAAYARLGHEAVGRYVFLRPEGEPPARVIEVRGDDATIAETFDRAIAQLWWGWDEGVFLPRFVEPDGTREPSLCRSCEVSEACLRGESTARLRFLRWLDGDADEGARALFLLGREDELRDP